MARCNKLGTVLCLVAVLLCERAAWAQSAEGFTVQPFDPSAASDRFFSAADATAPGDMALSARVDGMYAYKRILGDFDARTGGPENVIENQLYLYAGATLAIADQYLFGVTLPFVPTQNGESTRTPDGAALGDLELTARFAVLDFGKTVRIAPELSLSLPTGSQDSFTGDGTFGAHPRLLLSGKDDIVIYAVNLGYLLRDPKETPTLAVGPAATFGFAFGLQFLDDALQVGAELQGSSLLTGNAGFFDGDTTPIYVLGGAKFRVSSLVVGAAAGPSITKALGSSPRALLTLGYVPLDDP